MCVICVKPAGTEFPPLETMRQCFKHNGDGAGIMYAKGGQVYWLKGIMTFKRFENLYRQAVNAPELPFVFHFRIGTHGLKDAPSHCHPFPISNKAGDLTALKGTAPVAIAHNGIIYNLPKMGDFSDTMVFTARVLYPLLQHLNTKRADTIIGKYITGFNKLAILSGDGGIRIFGEFEDIGDGCLYSNTIWQPFAYDTPDAYRKPDCKVRYYCENYGYLCDCCENGSLYDDCRNMYTRGDYV